MRGFDTSFEKKPQVPDVPQFHTPCETFSMRQKEGVSSLL